MKTKAMKLGPETGSLMNYLQSGSKDNLPNVEKGATELLWTDRRAYFVNSVSKDSKSCTIERAKAVRIDNNGMSDCQNYRYEREENPVIYNLRFRYGSWYIDHGKDSVYGRYSKINIKFGYMNAYHDYSF